MSIGSWMGGAFGPPPASGRYLRVIVMLFGWFCAIFFGLCGIAAVRKLFDRGEQLRIGHEGICWPAWSDRTIPWREITDVTTWRFTGQTMIVLHLRDPAAFPPRGPLGALSGANRLLTGGDVAISLTGMDRGYRQALAAIDRFQERATG